MNNADIDHVYLLTSTTEEGNLLKNHAVLELVRTGFVSGPDDKRLSVLYGVKPRLYDFVASRCKDVVPDLRMYKHRLSTTVTTYLALSEAMERGFGSVAMFHDDVCFLKDTDITRDALTEIPDDGDIVMLSWHPSYSSWYYSSGVHDTYKSKLRKMPRWAVPDTNAALMDGSGTVYSRRGIDVMLRLYDTAWFPTGKYKYADRLKPYDYWFAPSIVRSVDKDVGMYLSNPLMCVQSWIRPRRDGKTFNDHRFLRTYAQCCHGIKESDYSVLETII